MPARTITASLAALLAATTSCSAQFLSGTHIANVILAEQSAINSSVECGRYYDDALPATIALRIFGNYTSEEGCINIGNAFSSDSYDNNTLVYAGTDGSVSSCDPFNTTCGRQIQFVGINHYSPTANYSQVEVDIFFDIIGNQLSQFGVKVFAGEACEENTAQPWYSWGGCTEAQRQEDRQETCQEVPYSVKSLRLERATPEQVSSGKCMIGAERGAGVRLSRAGPAALFGGVIVAGLMAVV